MTMALEGGEGSASRPGRYLPSRKTRYPLYRRLGGPQGRSGQVRKISPPPGFDPPTVQARSQSLYPATLPGPPHDSNLDQNTIRIWNSCSKCHYVWFTFMHVQRTITDVSAVLSLCCLLPLSNAIYGCTQPAEDVLFSSISERLHVHIIVLTLRRLMSYIYIYIYIYIWSTHSWCF